MSKATPEKVQELRETIRPMIPAVIDLFQGLMNQNASQVEAALVSLVVAADERDLLD